MVDPYYIVGAPGDDYGDIDPPWDPMGHLGLDNDAPTRGRKPTMGAMDDYITEMEVDEFQRENSITRKLDGKEWTTKDGRVMKVKQMTPSHARNTLEWLVRHYGYNVGERRIRESRLGRALKKRAKEES